MRGLLSTSAMTPLSLNLLSSAYRRCRHVMNVLCLFPALLLGRTFLRCRQIAIDSSLAPDHIPWPLRTRKHGSIQIIHPGNKFSATLATTCYLTFLGLLPYCLASLPESLDPDAEMTITDHPKFDLQRSCGRTCLGGTQYGQEVKNLLDCSFRLL